MVLEIRKIEIDCIIGDLPEERERQQRLTVDLRLTIPADAADTDAIEDTVDYAEVAEAVRDSIMKAKCRMIERAARLACEAGMADPRVRACEAAVEKAGAVPGIGSAVARYAQFRDGE